MIGNVESVGTSDHEFKHSHPTWNKTAMRFASRFCTVIISLAMDVS